MWISLVVSHPTDCHKSSQVKGGRKLQWGSASLGQATIPRAWQLSIRRGLNSTPVFHRVHKYPTPCCKPINILSKGKSWWIRLASCKPWTFPIFLMTSKDCEKGINIKQLVSSCCPGHCFASWPHQVNKNWMEIGLNWMQIQFSGRTNFPLHLRVDLKVDNWIFASIAAGKQF